MSILNISLQEGFRDDYVIVQINGKEVYQQMGVTTKLLLGYAVNFNVEVPECIVNLDIILPLKKLSQVIALDTKTKRFLGVSIMAGKIDCRISSEPFGYL